MYSISNNDMRQVIKYIEMMVKGSHSEDLRMCNTIRMARVLLRKLKQKDKK